ncbi:unnamed protein product, partial [Gongylonema pulchrum]|uniref:Ras-GEF domain-containing protein n=1 Tax=Gongylonema pulchrum TaxID=637853 RepID=A0A183DGP5_9BILA
TLTRFFEKGNSKKTPPSDTFGYPEIRSDKLRVTLREHAIVLLDVLIEAIDINDYNKLTLSLQACYILRFKLFTK